MEKTTGQALRKQSTLSGSGHPLPVVYPLDQARKHLFNLANRSFQSCVLLFWKNTKVSCKQKKIFQLTSRPDGSVEKLSELSLTASTTTLSYIGRYRSSSAPHLACESKPLGFWEGGCCRVNPESQGMALLPDFQLSEVLHAATSLSLSFFIYLQLKTDNCPPSTGLPC